MSVKLLTLVFLRRDDEVLLGYKKRGFGMGRWNGFGGKVEAGERVEDGARREVLEEAGVRVGALRKFGIVTCDYRNVEKPGVIEIHLFESFDFEGKFVESDEMRPHWFRVSEYPLDQAWSDDRFWWPWYLEGKAFRGRFHFDGYDAIIKHELTEGL